MFRPPAFFVSGPRLFWEQQCDETPMSAARNPESAARDPEVTIRRARADDAPALRAITGAGWRGVFLSAVGAENLAAMEERLLSDAALRALAADPAACAALALAEGAPAATALAFAKGGRTHVARLYVGAPFRRLGLGRALLGFCAAAFPETRGMSLNVETGNIAALAFYERLGFRQTGLGEETVGGVAFRVRMLER